MIRATVTAHADLETVVGVRVPSEVVFPWPEWPAEDDAPVAFPECAIARYREPHAAPTFTAKDPGPGLWALPELPKPGDAPPPLAPRAFAEWIAERLPAQGPVEPTPPAHPAHGRLVDAYKKRRATGRGLNPGSNLDVAWALARHNAELAVRMLALDGATAASLGIPASEIEILRRAGASLPGALRDAIVADFEGEQALLRQEAERAAAARARETEVLPVDLAAEGLIEVTTDDPRVAFGRVKVYDAPKRRTLMRSFGVPTGDITLHLATREGDVAAVRVRDSGTAGATRRELAEAGALDDAIVRALRNSRRPTERYDGSRFTGDARTVEGRHALQLLRVRAAQLVHSLANAPGAVGAYLMHLLLTLPVAWGGAVSLPNCVDAVQVALQDYAASKSRTRLYGPHGLADAAPLEVAWPQGLPKPDEIPRAMLAELARGSAWVWGEAARPPSPAEERVLRAQLDPGAFDRVVTDATGAATVVRAQEVYDRLFAEGLIASPTPNAEQRGRVSKLLERAGFTRAELDAGGKRARVWRRPMPDASATA